MVPNQERLFRRARQLNDVAVDTSVTTAGSLLTQSSAGVFGFATGPLHGVDVVVANDNVAIGNGVMASATGSNNVCMGRGAGKNVTTNGSVILGGPDGFIPGWADKGAAEDGCGENSVIIGASAMSEATVSNQGPFSVCVGPGCALQGIGQAAVCIGPFAGANAKCGDRAVVAGDGAGGPAGASAPVGEDSVCMSTAAQCQGQRAVSIGPASNASGNECVCVGNACTGFQHSIAIGNEAQALSGAIVLNATNNATASAASDSFTVCPIRTVAPADTSSEAAVRLPLSASGFSQILVYNPTTFEIQAVTLDSIV